MSVQSKPEVYWGGGGVLMGGVVNTMRWMGWGPRGSRGPGTRSQFSTMPY